MCGPCGLRTGHCTASGSALAENRVIEGASTLLAKLSVVEVDFTGLFSLAPALVTQLVLRCVTNDWMAVSGRQRGILCRLSRSVVVVRATKGGSRRCSGHLAGRYVPG